MPKELQAGCYSGRNKSTYYPRFPLYFESQIHGLFKDLLLQFSRTIEGLIYKMQYNLLT